MTAWDDITSDDGEPSDPPAPEYPVGPVGVIVFPSDPRAGFEVETYRDAEFRLVRRSKWGPTAWYVPEITLPWDKGTMLALTHPAGWFAWKREANGLPTHVGAVVESRRERFGR